MSIIGENEENNKKNRKEKPMSEREKKIIEAVAEALPNMSDFDKGYMLGLAESNRAQDTKETKSNEDVN